jgi:hypothetical protein
VRAVLVGAALRAFFPRFAATLFVCRERADLLAELRGSRFNAALQLWSPESEHRMFCDAGSYSLSHPARPSFEGLLNP